MHKEALTRHNFALSEVELATVQFVAEDDHHRSLSSALRAIVREYHTSHKQAFLVWQAAHAPKPPEDDYDPEELIRQYEAEQRAAGAAS